MTRMTELPVPTVTRAHAHANGGYAETRHTRHESLITRPRAGAAVSAQTADHTLGIARDDRFIASLNLTFRSAQ